MASLSTCLARWMKRTGVALALLLAFSAAGLVGSSLRAAGAFVAGLEDLPLMPGLAMVEGGCVDFDTPQGRIVEAYAKGKASLAEVLNFYATTLPQLGWAAGGQGEYRREGEVLRLELYQGESELTVRFYLSPS